MRKNTFLILILLFSIGSFKSAGFDCNKAYSSIEKMICSSERLSWLDEKLNYYYQNAIQNKQQSNEVKYKQRKWLKGTRNLCQDKKCLSSVYIERILELRRITEQKDEIALDMIFPELKFTDVFKDENTHLLLYSATNLEINDRKLYAINYYEKYPGSDRMSYLRIALLEKQGGEYIKLLDA